MNFNGSSFGSSMLYGGGREKSRIYIPSCVFCETAENYKDMYGRSYDLRVTSRELRDIENVLDSSNIKVGGAVAETRMAKEAPSIMGLKNVPGKQIYIPNGWNTSRFRFQMLVIEVMESCRHEHYIQGYTDYSDMSLSRMLDPRMKMYINSITTVVVTEDFTIPGKENYNILGTYNVITDTDGINSRIENPYAKNSLIRPMDLFDTINIKNAEYIDNRTSGMFGQVSETDASTVLRQGTINTSRRSNNNPISHITRSINTGVKGRLLTAASSDPSQAYAEASNLLSEQSYSRNGFISELYKLTGSLSPEKFEFSIISKIDPSCKIDVFRTTDRKLENLTSKFDFTKGTSGESEFSSIDVETSLALTAVHAINAILSENFISVGVFSISVINGDVKVIPAGLPKYQMPTIRGELEIFFLNAVILKITELVAPMLTQNFSYDLAMHFVSDVLGDTVVEISVGGRPKQFFRIPTFADSLFDPNITSLEERMSFVEGFESIIGAVSDVVNSNFTIDRRM